MQDDCLLFFVKYPEAGRVKTRVGKVIGYKESALLYKSLAEHNFCEINRAGKSIDIVVAYDPAEPEEKIKSWLRCASGYLSQEGAGLGERLTNVFQFAFKHGAKRVIALGSDTIDLKTELIRRAFEILRDKNAVIGPAKDGGYYLIGFSAFVSDIFCDIAWSHSQTMAQTIENLKKLEFSHSLLEELEDFDHPDQVDQIRLAAQAAGKD